MIELTKDLEIIIAHMKYLEADIARIHFVIRRLITEEDQKEMLHFIHTVPHATVFDIMEKADEINEDPDLKRCRQVKNKSYSFKTLYNRQEER